MENKRNLAIQNEIKQGLRSPTGSFIGDPKRPGLNVLEYAQGWTDFEERALWPKNPTPSYELGRHRASLEAEEKANLIAAINERHQRTMAAIQELTAKMPETPPTSHKPPQS